MLHFFFFFSIWKLVRDNVHKAFWDILQSELNDDPPEYGQAIRLLEEIKEVRTICLHLHWISRDDLTFSFIF